MTLYVSIPLYNNTSILPTVFVVAATAFIAL